MDLLKNKTEVLVAGAGIAGCAAAQKLQSNGIDYLLVEKHVEPGGLTRSISVGDAHFDYTGHFMHLAKCESPSAIPYASQKDSDWMLVRRRSAVYVEGEMVPAPLQYNLYYIPGQTRERCIEGFINRPEINNIQTFKEYLLTGFGQGICDCFLIPYNEKLLARPLDELSIESITRFFPAPDTKKIESGYSEEGVNLETGYNSSFWYPKSEGIGLLARGLARDLYPVQKNCNIKTVDLRARLVYTSLGKIHYKYMLMSMPLKDFCERTNDPSLQSLATLLRHTRIFCLNILIRGSMPKIFEGLHWIYVPEKRIPFYRIGIYSNISRYINPKDATALYIEAAFLDNAQLPEPVKLIDEIFLCLESLGWAGRNECVALSANWIDCAYIHFDFYRNDSIHRIFNILKGYCVYPIGRYGLWDYISMEDAILSSIKTATMFI